MPESCRDSAFDNYVTTIRSAGSWITLGKVITSMMATYSWRHVVVMNDQIESSYCSAAATAVMNGLSDFNAKIGNTTYIAVQTQLQDSPTQADIDLYLDTIQRRTRGKEHVP